MLGYLPLHGKTLFRLVEKRLASEAGGFLWGPAVETTAVYGFSEVLPSLSMVIRSFPRRSFARWYGNEILSVRSQLRRIALASWSAVEGSARHRS